MAHKIQVKRGNKADLPTLDAGEFGLCQDTNELFIGNNGNQKIFPPTAPTISDIEGLQTALDNKVDNSRVLTNVPANAKFTDTTYSEISTSEIDAGTASTLRTITARRMKYLLDKIVALFPTKTSELTNDSGFLTSVTKSDVGLSNVDNVKQATKVEFDEHKNDNATLETLGHVKRGVLTTTLNTTWSGSSAPFTKTQTVTGILATDTPIVDVIMSGTYATDETRQEAWNNIYRITTANNSITLYAKEKPTVDLPIQLKVVR